MKKQKSVVETSVKIAEEASRSRSDLTFPTLVDFSWRVDVSISTNHMQRTLTPLVMTEMVLSDGSVHKMEMTMEQFHDLRYQVARVLKDIEDIEKLPVMKLETKDKK